MLLIVQGILNLSSPSMVSPDPRPQPSLIAGTPNSFERLLITSTGCELVSFVADCNRPEGEKHAYASSIIKVIPFSFAKSAISTMSVQSNNLPDGLFGLHIIRALVLGEK